MVNEYTSTDSKMRKTIFILCLLFSFDGFAQFEYVDQSELYRKYGIQEVNAFDNDSVLVNDQRWLIDEKGRIYSDILLGTQTDSTESLETHIFKNDLLVKSYDIGVWNTRTNKIDTNTTRYSYNEKGQVVSSFQSSTRTTTQTRSTFSYQNDLLSCRTFGDSISGIFAIDSMFYYPNSMLHIKSHTSFLFDFFDANNWVPDRKTSSYYDTTGHILQELAFQIENNHRLTPIRSKTFDYENGKMVRIIVVHLGTVFNYPNGAGRTVEHFYYDNKGFIIMQEWYSGYQTEPYLVYTYDYK